MQTELSRHHTRVVLSDAPWSRGIQRLVVGEDVEIPFLMPALSGHHFFTGAWPPPPGAVDYEPHESPGTLTRLSDMHAVWHQPETRFTQVETRIEYEIVDTGTVTARFNTRSHAAAYPHGYVGLFWGTIAAGGGQRGMHLLLPGESDTLRWRYFQAGGDCWSCRANTVLGPHMPSAAHSPGHPPTYFISEATRRFALPIQAVRWRDLYYSLEVDSPDVAFTNVLLGTAIGGPSWDLYWRLRPGEVRSICCRITVGAWPGWEAIEQRFRTWCVEPWFAVEPTSRGVRQPQARPRPVPVRADGGLALSTRLFETRGRPLLERLGLLDRCSVGCFGGTSQNAGLDDATSRDHCWGPYLIFLLCEADWEAHGPRLQEAVAAMPDEVDGTRWIGYDSPTPRRTLAWSIPSYLQALTGLASRPETDREWLPHLGSAGFLGRRWTEQLFDAGQGEVFHDPGKQFIELWRHWTAYLPPDIHRALLARSLFRVWNAGPEYNLRRAHARRDHLAFALCRDRFVEEALELAFTWNEQFVPTFKWRAAHFRRLPICPAPIRTGLEGIAESTDAEACLHHANAVTASIKRLMKDLYHLPTEIGAPLAAFAQAMHRTIDDEEVRRQTPLDW
jgi:Domain of unknown function (DUF4037)